MRNLGAALVLTLLTFLAIPVVLVSAVPGWGGLFLTYGTWMMRVGRAILGIDVAVEGRDRLDRTRPCVFMSNHLSFLDGPLLVTVADRPLRFIAKRFVFRIPVLGLGMRSAGYVFIDKTGVGSGRTRITEAVRMIGDKGYSFLIFPEGERSRDGRTRAFRRGGFFLALEAGAPIVPVSINGTYELMPPHARRIRKGRVRIVFHEPVDVSGYAVETMPELIERVRAAIESGLVSG